MELTVYETQGMVVLDDHELEQVNGDGPLTGVIILGLVSLAAGIYSGYKGKEKENE